MAARKMTTLHVFILLLPDHVDWRQHPSAVRWIWGVAENLDKLWVCQPGQAGAGDKGQGQFSSLVLTPGWTPWQHAYDHSSCLHPAAA
jgi:hypothetical protein